MRVLHLTDFHFKDNPKFYLDQSKVVESIITDLINESKIDYIFFTGDLVYSGEKLEDFDKAKVELFDKLTSKLKIESENVFICCGNHDVFRYQELQDTADFIFGINSTEELESFLNRQDGKSYAESLKNIEHYRKFEKEFYSEISSDSSIFFNDLFTIHNKKFNSTNIGILSLNSSWRAIDSKTDRRNLLYPISILKEAVYKLKSSSDFRIALMHHPISDFKDWNATQIEDLIYQDFHLLFSGHLHKKKQEIQICSDEGIFCCASPATLTFHGGSIGYTVLDIDIENYEIEIHNRQYNSQDNCFLRPNEIQNINIPVGEEKRKLNKFKKTLRKRYFEEVEKANDLFISFDYKGDSMSFQKLFTMPILKSKSKAEIADKRKDSPLIELDAILDNINNYVMVGKDKSGKTSILTKLLLELLNNFTLHKQIPLYVDANMDHNNKIDLVKKISRYFELNKSSTNELLEKFSLVLLLDNYDPNDENFNKSVSSFLRTYTNVRFIAVTQETLTDNFVSYDFDNRDYEDIYIHEIKRQEVRSLTTKWPNISVEKKEIIIEKIHEIFAQLNIPKNYWTVSLFLWIFEKNSDVNFHNSFELIQLYIDNLLDRKQLALDNSSKLKYDDYKAYLAELAFFLLKDRAAKKYTASYNEIVQFTDSYRKRNKRFVIDVKAIIELILEKGIIKKIFKDAYTFRLNGVFEYFLALYMTKSKDFLDRVIKDDHYYLSFKNELELFAGFEKNNESFLRTILDRTKGIFKGLNKKYENTNLDNQLVLKVSEVFDITQPINKLSKSISSTLTLETQDKLKDEMSPIENPDAHVKVKQFYDSIEENSNNLEKALFILSRVFRNSNVENNSLVNESLDYILNCACQLGFKLINEAEENPSTEKIKKDENLVVQLLTNFMPLIVQTFFYDAIAQSDLERIFLEKINELKENQSENQFKLLVLYLTLIDLDISNGRKYLEDLMGIISLNTLNQTILVKLYYYLMFKCSNNSSLELYIRDKIRSQSETIESKTDKGLVNQNVDDLRLIKKAKKK